MNALDVVARRVARPFVRRGGAAFDFTDWMNLLNQEGLAGLLPTTLLGDREIIDQGFRGMTVGTYLRNPIVFACLSLRARLFSEARFQFQQLRGGRPGNLFGTPDLQALEHPEPGKTTGDLLSEMILDADLGGTAVRLGERDRIRRLRPDWVTILYGLRDGGPDANDYDGWHPDVEVIGVGYSPGGPGIAGETLRYLAEEVAIFAPTRHPLARAVGIPILTAALNEVAADTAATRHKLSFFNNAATPNLALKLPPTMSKDKAEEWIELFEQDHRGVFNAYKTVYFGGGVEPQTIGLNFQQMDFKALQGAVETRVAALTGMHPVVAGLSEGLGGSALNEGNYTSARRSVGDTTLRPLWRNVAASLETIVPALPGTRLWYDDRDIAFLRDDVTDQAEIQQKYGSTIGQYIKDGFEPDSAVDAVVSGDPTRLIHTGLVSVQLQPPGTVLPNGQVAPAGAAPQALFLSGAQLRAFLAQGWRPATRGDEEIVRAALQMGSLGPVATMRARRDFWPIEDPLARWGSIGAGSTYDSDHPLVRAFPSLFEAVTEDLGARVKRLAAAGLPAPAIAAQIDRSERHVRRLLAGATS